MVTIYDGEMAMTRHIMYDFDAEIRHSIQATAFKVRQHMSKDYSREVKSMQPGKRVPSRKYPNPYPISLLPVIKVCVSYFERPGRS